MEIDKYVLVWTPKFFINELKNIFLIKFYRILYLFVL
jgi:hypothetical protein